ncbi:MAG: HBL/NHE enterotoxin family protein [Verrucomicrobiales bacterium]
MNHHAFRTINGLAQSEGTAALQAKSAIHATGASALAIQGYAHQVLKQPKVSFDNLSPDVLKKLPDINGFLDSARQHANAYLGTGSGEIGLQSRMINVITDIGGYSTEFTNFYSLISDKINAWKATNDPQARKDALDLLAALKGDVGEKKSSAHELVSDLQSFRSKLSDDAQNFNTARGKIEVIMTGKNGVVKNLDQQMSDLDGKIAGAIAGVAVSGLTIIGGGFLIAVGAIGSFITAGTSLPLVGVGIAIVVTGAGGAVASSIVLANLIDTKNKLISQKSEIEGNLRCLSGIQSQIGSLNSSISPAITATSNLTNAWTFLDKNLGQVADSLREAKSGQLPVLVEAYLETANTQWGKVTQTVDNIENQLTNVQTKEVAELNGDVVLPPAA